MIILMIAVVVIMLMAITGLIVIVVKDLRDAKERKERSKELTAAPEKNRFDINLEQLRPEVYNTNMMGSNIRRV